MTRQYLIVAMLLSTIGCTSFRTTALHRLANDSVAPQKTNKKLKGLPVKLKVPSHVQVSVYEQQVILSESIEDIANLKKAAESKTTQYNVQDEKVKNLAKNLDIARKSRLKAQETLKIYKDAFDAAEPNSADKAVAETFLIKSQEILDTAVSAETRAQSELNSEPQERDKLKQLKEEKELAIQQSTVGYTLVSFSPPQYIVERELQYTDKVFLVDFKRPAGGILNLTEASMDDEQYFSKVQAEITERTLEDVGYALKTVADPLSKLGTKPKGNTAIPTSSETPVAETNANVNFQKSVIATQRFDISEAGWEERLQAFVSEFIAVDNGQPDVPGYPIEMAPEVSDGPVLLRVHDGHSGLN